MKKNSSILAINAVVLILIILNKKCKPILNQLSKEYMRLKKEYKSGRKPYMNYKKSMNQVLNEAKKNIGDIGIHLKDVLESKYIDCIHCDMLSEDVRNYLNQRLEENYFEIQDIQSSELLSNQSNAHGVVPLKSEFVKSNLFRQLYGTIALIVAFNSWEIPSIEMGDYSLAQVIIEDLEQLFTDIVDYKVYAAEHVETVCEWTVDEKVEVILLSNTSYEEKFDRIFSLKELSFEQAMNRVIHSGITSYENIFKYILSMNCLKPYERLQYIISSDIVSYEELFCFIVNINEFTIDEKIWYILLIPNIPFKTVWNDLFLIDGVSQDQIVYGVFHSNIVPFHMLFDAILSIDGISSKKFMEYIIHYQTDYQVVTVEEKIQYILCVNLLSNEEKAECIWNLLSDYSLNDRIQFLLNFYNITYEEFLNLGCIQHDNLTDEQNILLIFFEKMNVEKEKFILEHYAFESKEQLYTVIAGCAAEGANHYDDLYWVANTLFNRITHPYYVKKGVNPYLQFIAPGQFEVYEKGLYLHYLYPISSQYAVKYEVAKQAFYDMFYDSYDGIRHNYTEFRSWNTISFSNNYVVHGGNRYGSKMSDDIRIQYEDLYHEELSESSFTYVKKMSFSEN